MGLLRWADQTLAKIDTFWYLQSGRNGSLLSIEDLPLQLEAKSCIYKELVTPADKAQRDDKREPLCQR